MLWRLCLTATLISSWISKYNGTATYLMLVISLESDVCDGKSMCLWNTKSLFHTLAACNYALDRLRCMFYFVSRSVLPPPLIFQWDCKCGCTVFTAEKQNVSSAFFPLRHRADHPGGRSGRSSLPGRSVGTQSRNTTLLFYLDAFLASLVLFSLLQIYSIYSFNLSIFSGRWSAWINDS